MTGHHSRCDICNGPNPTGNDTCSRTCETDLAFALGHITDYPEENHMDTTTRTIPALTDAQRQAYIAVAGQADHPHTPGVQCMTCRQNAVNFTSAVALTLRAEAQAELYDHLADYIAADPYGEVPGRMSAVEYARHEAQMTRQRLDLHRLPDAWIGALPTGYEEA